MCLERVIAVRVVSLLVLMVLSAARGVQADDLQLIPAVMLKEEYNDNIFFTSTGTRSSFITTPAAMLTLHEKNERLSLELNGRLNGLIYSADSGLNDIEQAYRGRGSYALTPNLTVDGDAAFSRESRPDRFIESSGLVVRQKSSLQEYLAGADATLTELLGGQLRYEYLRVDYHDPAVSNLEGHSVRGFLQYDLGRSVPLLKLRWQSRFDQYRYSASMVDSSSLAVGASYPFNELWTIQGDVGCRFTHAEFATPAPAPTSNNLGLVSELIATYQNETDRATLTFSRELQNAAGRSGAVESTTVALQLMRRFSYELTGSLGGGFHHNRSSAGEFSFRPIDETSIAVHPTLRYTFSRELALEIFYEYALVQDHQAQTEATRNKAWISLTATTSLFP